LTGSGLVIVFPFFIPDNVNQALIVSNLSKISPLFLIVYSRALDRNFLLKMIRGIGSAFVGIIIIVITRRLVFRWDRGHSFIPHHP